MCKEAKGENVIRVTKLEMCIKRGTIKVTPSTSLYTQVYTMMIRETMGRRRVTQEETGGLRGEYRASDQRWRPFSGERGGGLLL